MIWLQSYLYILHSFLLWNTGTSRLLFYIVQQMMKGFSGNGDQLLNDDESKVVEIQNQELNEQIVLLKQYDEDEESALVKIVNSMFTEKRMKDLLDGKIKLAQ